MARELGEIWRAFSGSLFELLGPERFNAFIRNARPVLLDDECFVFHVETTYARDKIETLVGDTVLETARRVTNRRVRIVVAVDRDTFNTPFASPMREAAAVREIPATFASYVAGPGNRLAVDAARAFALGGPRSPRMLLVVAPSGLGKSHLLRAIHADLIRQPSLGALHFTGEQFRRHFTWAAHRGHTEGFLKKCRGAGILLFDDLHLLDGKEEAQTALADVLSTLETQGARVALTSLRHPRRLDVVSPALRRRLHADLEVSIDRPDPATALGVLRGWAPAGVPEPVLDYLAQHVHTSHKDQLQVLSSVLDQGTVTLAAARAAVSEFLNQWSQGLTYTDIVRAAAETFGVRVSEIYSPGRTRAAADARHVCFYLARKLLGEPYARIGDHFGGRDHATVLQACRRIESEEGPVRNRLRRLERSLSTP